MTSAILEGSIYGHKCLYLNFHDNDYYHQDLPQEIVITKNNQKNMRLKIKENIIESKMRSKEIFEISKKRSNFNY